MRDPACDGVYQYPDRVVAQVALIGIYGVPPEYLLLSKSPEPDPQHGLGYATFLLAVRGQTIMSATLYLLWEEIGVLMTQDTLPR